MSSVNVCSFIKPYGEFKQSKIHLEKGENNLCWGKKAILALYSKRSTTHKLGLADTCLMFPVLARFDTLL